MWYLGFVEPDIQKQINSSCSFSLNKFQCCKFPLIISKSHYKYTIKQHLCEKLIKQQAFNVQEKTICNMWIFMKYGDNSQYLWIISLCIQIKDHYQYLSLERKLQTIGPMERIKELRTRSRIFSSYICYFHPLNIIHYKYRNTNCEAFFLQVHNW